MTILFSSLLLAVSCFQLLITCSESFKTIAKYSSNAKAMRRSSTQGMFFTARNTCRRTFSSLSQSTESQEDIQTFNTDAVIPTERWDFADDIFLITTTEQGSERLEKTKQQLEKVNMMRKVKIRTFKPDDEDRVRGCYSSHIKILYEIQNQFKNKKNYSVIVLEDNLEITKRMSEKVLSEVAAFVDTEKNWDVFHLAYMMYVPGLSLKKLPAERTENVVRMITEESASVGTSAYIISKKGVDTFLELDRQTGYTEAIPNIMAKLFPNSRFAAYPMVFHRAAKIGSLVNPQLDDFRKIMFNPMMYTTWIVDTRGLDNLERLFHMSLVTDYVTDEKLMVSTGLQNNQLFPALLVSLLLTTGVTVYSAVMANNNDSAGVIGSAQLLVAIPLAVALWGASLFKPGNTGAGFAKTKQQQSISNSER